MTRDFEASIGDGATVFGQPQRQSVDASLGDERTVGDGPSAPDTILDGMEVVDLEARYRMEGTLGRGGMGAVVLATDTRLDRKVAIKRILGKAAGDRSAVNRFLTEAKAIAALNHHNIVQIYDYGRAADGPFLIIEYVDGGSLLDLCKAGAVPVEKAVEIICQVCDGLARAHDLGIIHRDIKPANVLLTKDGVAKLTDFGLAKPQAGDGGGTIAGAVLGTPDFMPPEQRRDAALVDHRSDLWSLAATTYQMVSGRSPKIIRFDLLPAGLTKVLGRALEDEKEVRYQSARELRDAFREAVHGGPSPAATASIAGALQEGRCSACGAANADPSRKFCRACGGSLRVTCLKCDAQIPVWDAICGECGGNQRAILPERLASLQAQRDSAEAARGAHAYHMAISAAESLAALTHPALAEFADWGRTFAAAVTAERDRHGAAVAERLVEARTHLAAFDYAAAIQTLELIPGSLRDGEAGSLLAECIGRRDDADSLLRSIGARIQSRELEGLIPVVERAIVLRGDRADLRKLHRQLVERRDARLAQAKAAFDDGHCRTAGGLLAEMCREDMSDESGEILAFVDRVRSAADLEDRLAVVVKDAKADGKITTGEAIAILTAAQKCLEANPANEKLRTLIRQCQEIARPTVLKSSIGIELKLIPAGTFSMGDAAGTAQERPFQVTLSRAFYIGVHVVTNAQWARVMGNVPSRWKDADRPVDTVSWEDAEEFCRKLSALPQERAAGRVYRLPTEAEWEYACRAGTTSPYSFGDERILLDDHAWFDGNAGGQTHLVGQKKPNPWGLYDMHGNVWEWCSDWEGDYPLRATTDPAGPVTGAQRIYRGGGWNTPARICRSAFRSGRGPSSRGSNLGFRVAMSVTADEMSGPTR